MINQSEQAVRNLLESWSGFGDYTITKLPVSGSSREYFRIQTGNQSFIGCFNDNVKENQAFFKYTRHFLSKKLPVPEIFAISEDGNTYILEDLGNTTLFDFIQANKNKIDDIKAKYKQAIADLINFQLSGHEGLDYSVAYPRKAFDYQSMLWDLNYFKHYFIKLAGVSFHEQELEDDFHSLIKILLKAPSDFFMFRDFQSRNIMLYRNKLFYIDYQGGRKGALAYDLASLLFDAKANLSPALREELLSWYIKILEKHNPALAEGFEHYYYPYVLIRIMQAFGAFGYRGFFERKTHFLQSIPFAIKNLEWLLHHNKIPDNLPVLTSIFEKIVQSPNLKEFDYRETDKLRILINSFSYKRQIPLDNSGHGGGFVFDCRFLPNPGRLQKFASLTGKDPEVKAWLDSFPECSEFFNHCTSIIAQAVNNYLERNFNHLMICFGCTGGQHRSVYFAEKLADFLRQEYHNKIELELRHIELQFLKRSL